MKIYRGKIKRKRMRKRAKICLCLMLLLFGICAVRLCVLNLNERITTAAQSSGTTAVELGKIRRNIYDRNLLPMISGEEEYYICASPTLQSYTTLSKFLMGESLLTAEDLIKENRPFVIKSDENLSGAGLCSVVTKKRYGIADHIIGYVDADGVGISGIEKDYDNLLRTDEAIKLRYSSSAVGDILSGITPSVEMPTSDTNGVVLTLDKNIQLICEEAMSSVTAGAAVVCEVQTGEILALCSRPDFDADNVSSYLDSSASPLLNRALTNYNVGSVFKPLIAAAAIEGGFDETYTVECTGSVVIGENTFHCNAKEGHGRVDFKTAISKSCNVFFYDLIQRINVDDCLKLCSVAELDKEYFLSESIQVPAGSFASKYDLSSLAARANFAIGQGDLMLSPLKICSLYCTIANGGKYTRPSLIKGITTEQLEYEDKNISQQIISDQTAKLLCEYLSETTISGTGVSADSRLFTSAGKTATAQTGIVIGKNSICQGWFAGVFPAVNPKYCITIMVEDAQSGSVDCAPLFKRISEGIYNIYKAELKNFAE